jgi:imidazolonepropionase-like amidohydrolase
LCYTCCNLNCACGGKSMSRAELPQFLIGFLLLVCGFVGSCLGADGQKVIVIHAGQLFGGNSDGLLSNQVIVIEGDLITDVGPAGSVKIPAGAQEIDLGKATVLPGLIDGHGHVFKSKELDLTYETFLKYSWQYRTIFAVVNAKKDLEAGFTTARDLMSAGAMYSDVDLRRAIDEGIVPGPRLQVATVGLIGTSWGEGYEEGGLSPEVTAPLGVRAIDSPWEGRKAVRENVKYGADFIKVFMGFANLRPDGTLFATPTMSLEEERAIVDEAHRHGVKAACNGQAGAPLEESIEANCDSIELGIGLDPASVNKMAEKGIFVTMALARIKIKAAAEFKASGGRYSRAEIQKASFQRALHAGVKISFATNPGQRGGPDHGEQAIEFERMVEYGMTPAQALRSATSVNAELMGWQDRVGSIEKGKYADIIAVSGNPLNDVTEMQRVKFVMKGGEIVWNGLSQGEQRSSVLP